MSGHIVVTQPSLCHSSSIFHGIVFSQMPRNIAVKLGIDILALGGEFMLHTFMNAEENNELVFHCTLDLPCIFQLWTC